MNAAPPVKQLPAGNPPQDNWAATHKRRDLLLWYWSLAFPRRGRWLRTAYLQPVVGALVVLLGIAVGVFGWTQNPVIAAPAIVILGIVIAVLSYPMSVLYSFEYPGRFDRSLEEYVARRVSRLSKKVFIPRYQTHDDTARKAISKLNRRVRLALKIEKVRLKQSEHTSAAPVCGILVVGPRHSYKTGALWNAMAHELKGWTFVKWPHHMDHPANLVSRLGHRIVLWIDDLQTFARPGEAAALTQFIQQLRDSKQQFLVLSSCADSHDEHNAQDEHGLQEAKRYFSPLIADLQLVSVNANESLDLRQRIEDLEKAYRDDLSEVQRGVLRSIDWLQSMRVSTYPEIVLDVLNKYFLNANAAANGNQAWDAAIRGLASPPARFVRIDQHVEAETRLSGEPYNFRDWFRYNFFRKFFQKKDRLKKKDTHPYNVIEPVNARYLQLEDSPADRARNITDTLQRRPNVVIELLANYPVTAETLILLGDAYLNHLGETIDNANELALACYSAALQIFDVDTTSHRFPGAWAAALVGMGTAELRRAKATAADTAFSRVTGQTPDDGARPIPPLLKARAWHGRGDVMVTQVPSPGPGVTSQLSRLSQLRNAASYYERATTLLSARDPLCSEAKLDRADTLYEIALAAFREYEQPRTGTPDKPPIDVIMTAQKAYQEARLAYVEIVAPTTWAEAQRRQGELFRMTAICLLPTEMQTRVSAVNGGAAMGNPFADERDALTNATIAREHFIAAGNVFAPLYLPTSWAQTQVGLVRALLIIARIVARTEKHRARPTYSRCIELARATLESVSRLAESPLDWVDLQLLYAQAEIGLGALGEGDAPEHYQYAQSLLKRAGEVLDAYGRLPENPTSERITTQKDTLKALGQQIVKAPPGP